MLIGDGKVMPHGGAPAGTGKTVDVLTDDAGLASCDWQLDGVNWSQQVEATLLDSGNNPIHLPIRFNANLSIADQVAYDPGKVCASLQNQKTVQKAIDTLATLASVYHVSGDDQSVLPTGKLHPLVVVAASKCGPVAGMKVVFTVISGGGKVMPEGGPPQGTGSTVTVATDAQGLASCDWTIGTSPDQIVEAVLQPGPNPIVPPTTVRFTAQIRGAGADPGFHVKGMGLISNGAPLRNNMDLGFNLLSKGLRVDCDDTVDPASVISKLPSDNPVCFVTVDIPYPFTPADRDFYGVPSACFQTIILGAKVEAKENQISWLPSTETMRWVAALFAKLKAAPLPQQVLTRLVIRGNSVWAKEKPDVYLDGDLFVERTQDEVRLPSGDQRRGGDLILWFWLVSGP